MKIDLSHAIKYDPVLEDVGKIKINTIIFSEYGILTFNTSSLAEEFIHDGYNECCSKEELKNYLTEAEGINDDDIADLLRRLKDYVDEVTCPASCEYSPGCVLKVWLHLDLDDSPSQIEEEAAQASFDDDNDDGAAADDSSQIEEEAAQADDSQIEEEEEAAQASFDEISIRFRPASKLVVKSLIRKIYKTKSTKMDKMKNLYNSFFANVTKSDIHRKISLEACTICLEEFSNGGRVVTLPCGHDFDEKCIVKWLETSHVCPMCRFKLPCEVLCCKN